MRTIPINRDELQILLNNGFNARKIGELLGCCPRVVFRRVKRYGLKFPHRKLSEAEKAHLSKARIAWMKANPNKLRLANSRVKSVPCEKLKALLRANNIQFVEEFRPLNDRYFMIDVAMPDLKLGFEVNGNQHYECAGKLNAYHQNRHDLIEKAGWKLYELHYLICFKPLKLIEIILNAIASTDKKIEFNYSEYKPRTRVPKVSEVCPNWRNRPRPETRKVIRPDKYALSTEIWKTSLSHVARRLGVAVSTVHKWCKEYGIETPQRGYRMKVVHKKLVPTVGVAPTPQA